MGPTKKDPRPGAQHARAFHDKWESIQNAVRLYAAGIAWKGARIGVLLATHDEIDWRGELQEDALRELLPDWFINGHTTLTFPSHPPIRLVPPGTANSFELVVETPPTSPWEEPGLTLLWPACHNFEAIEQMSEFAKAGNRNALKLTGQLLGFALSSLHLPGWALEPQSAAQADSHAVHYDLHWYALSVSQFRQDFQRSLRSNLHQLWHGQEPGLSDVLVDWNREWFPDDPFARWPGVYESFARCGLTLVRFGQEYVAQLRECVESGLLPRSILAGWEELGL